MISTTLLEGENVGAEVATLALFHLWLLQSSSSLLLYLRNLLAFAAHQVCPGVLSFRIMLRRADKFLGSKTLQSTVNTDNLKTKLLNKKRIEHKLALG